MRRFIRCNYSLKFAILAFLPIVAATARVDDARADSDNSPRPSLPEGYFFDPHTAEVLHGMAALAHAQGELAVKLQEAERLRLKNRSELFKVHKEHLQHLEWVKDFKALDEVRKRQREDYRKFVDSLTNPPLVNKLTGEALNALFKELKDHPELSIGRSVPVRSEWLPNINVNAGESGNLGLLRKPSLPWPMMLQRPEFATHRDGIEAQLRQMQKQAAYQGTVSFQDWKGLADQVVILEDRLRAANRTAGGDDPVWTPTRQVFARRFLQDLKGVVSGLDAQRTDLAEYLSPLRGGTVAEVVLYMDNKGVKFAPATAGSERFYILLHGAMVEEVKRLGLDRKQP